MNIHHGEFTLHALLYIARLITEQKYEEVIQLGLRRDQVDVIRSMTTEDIHTVALSIRANFLNIHLEPDAFDLAISVMKRRRKDEDLDCSLILAGARYEMMHELSGLTSEDYAKHRRYLGITDGKGRPPSPSEEERTAVWVAWLERNGEPNKKQRFLDVYKNTGVPVGTIWRLVQEWESTGINNGLSGSDNRKNRHTEK